MNVLTNIGPRIKRGLAVSLSFAAIQLVAMPLSAGEFDGVNLRVATWGGSWKANIEEYIVPKFEAEGGTIEFVTGSPQANFARLVAARGQSVFDVMEVLDAQVSNMHELEALAPIDTSQIPNVANIAEYQLTSDLIGSWHTQEVICYNVDKFAELGLPAPKTYSDLIEPELSGRVSFPDINSGGGLANLGAVTYAAGGDVNNIQPGLDIIKEMNVLKFWSRGGETLAQFQSGDIYAAVANAGWCLRTKKAGVNVTSVHPQVTPEIQGVAKVGWLGIMTDSKNVEAAHWYINQYLEEDFQLLFASKSGITPINKLAIARMDEDPIVAEMLELDPTKIAKQQRLDYSTFDVSKWTDQWNRQVSQ